MHNQRPQDDDLHLPKLSDARCMIWVTMGRDGSRQNAVIVSRITAKGNATELGRWVWSTTGVPAPVVSSIAACVWASVEEELTTRYGIAEQLPF